MCFFYCDLHFWENLYAHASLHTLFMWCQKANVCPQNIFNLFQQGAKCAHTNTHSFIILLSTHVDMHILSPSLIPLMLRGHCLGVVDNNELWFCVQEHTHTQIHFEGLTRISKTVCDYVHLCVLVRAMCWCQIFTWRAIKMDIFLLHS